MTPWARNLPCNSLTRKLVALSIHINPHRIAKPKIQTSKNYVEIDTHENAIQVAKIQRDSWTKLATHLPPTSVIMVTTSTSLVTSVVSPFSNLNE